VLVASITALVEPALLEWARRSANLEPLAAARKINVPDDRITEWESGDRAPTIAELRRAAAVYNRALGVFFLPEPPTGFETLRDFRRLAGGSLGEWSAALHAEYRRSHAQREALLEIAVLDDVDPATGWRIEPLPGTDGELANAARTNLLGFAPLPFPRPSADEYAHLNFWTAAIEESGIFVMSSSGGRVLTDEMRAFSLYFDRVPVIVLNGADWPRGRIFSLVHEYVHLLLHSSGLCDTTTDTRATTENRRLEARCNAIAAAVLMPAKAVLEQSLVKEHEPGDEWTLGDLIEVARTFGVSVEAFLRRLATLEHVPLSYYQDFRKSQSEEAMRGSRSAGGNFYNTKARDLGKGYVRLVTDAHRRTLIDSTTAATFLDVKVGQIARLAEKARR
jgi:Zn-dependent peptidase ImmA (M78 family)/transcriptional regulator with XRE-family HTH domain